MATFRHMRIENASPATSGGPAGCPRKHRGARNELIAVTWLLDQGYEVFRNVSQHGEIDIIAIKGDEILRLDVKAGPNRPLANDQIAHGVKLLAVEGNACGITESRVRAGSLICFECGQPFQPRRLHCKFCSTKCRGKNHKRQANGGFQPHHN
jgi:hypothetical protein